MNRRIPTPIALCACAALMQLAACAERSSGIRSLEPAWTFRDPDRLLVPESVVIDHDEPALYVSNGIGGSGRISKFSLDGEMLESQWLGGLHEPLGLAIADGHLYISDYGALHVVRLADRDGERYWPGTRQCIVGDVAVDVEGRAHCVVYFRGRTSLCTLEGDQFTEIIEFTQMESPNGILAQDGRLFIAGAREVASCHPDGSDWRVVYENPGIEQFDGIHPDGAGGFYLTSFLGGEIMHLRADGGTETLGVFLAPMDLDVDLGRHRLYVPARHHPAQAGDEAEQGILMALDLVEQASPPVADAP